jgi:hypothetical protein
MVGDQAKAHRQTNLPHPIGSVEGKRELEEFIRWYECASLEQLAWDQKRPGLFSHLPQRQPAPVNESAAPAPTRGIVPVREVFVPAAIAMRPVTVGFKKNILDDLRASIPEKTVDDPRILSGIELVRNQAGALNVGRVPSPANASCGVGAPRPQSDSKEDVLSEDRITVTRADLERYRALYENPDVLAELARKLVADPGQDLETDYLEFLETKAAGADMNERTPIAGPQGLVMGNLRARTGPGLPTVDSLADEQRRIARLRARMQEIEAMHSAAKPAPLLSAEAADAIASDKSV